MKDILAVVGFSKATYMYWQKRFDRVDPNKELEERILAIHDEHKDFGYRRVLAILRKEGICVNKKKVKRIMQKLNLQVTSYTHKRRVDVIIPIRGKLAELHQIEFIDAFIHLSHIKRLLRTLQNLSIMKLMRKDE